MSFTAHDLIILDKVSCEKLTVCVSPYSSVVHPVFCKRTWPFSQFHLETTLSRTPNVQISIISTLWFPFNLLFQLILLKIPPTLDVQKVSTFPCLHSGFCLFLAFLCDIFPFLFVQMTLEYSVYIWAVVCSAQQLRLDPARSRNWLWMYWVFQQSLMSFGSM